MKMIIMGCLSTDQRNGCTSLTRKGHTETEIKVSKYRARRLSDETRVAMTMTMVPTNKTELQVYEAPPPSQMTAEEVNQNQYRRHCLRQRRSKTVSKININVSLTTFKQDNQRCP
jgi:hypothetical protein